MRDVANLFTLRGDGINFVDEDDSGGVLLGLLEGFAKIALGFTSHLAHDFGTVDQEEEGAGLVRHSSRHQGLTGTRRTEHEDTSGRLDTDGLEQLGMTEGQFDQLSDLSHLFTAATNVVVADISEIALLIFPLDGLAFGMDDGVLRDDTKFGWICLHHFEFNSSHATTDEEGVSLANRSVGLSYDGSVFRALQCICCATHPQGSKASSTLRRCCHSGLANCVRKDTSTALETTYPQRNHQTARCALACRT